MAIMFASLAKTWRVIFRKKIATRSHDRAIINKFKKRIFSDYDNDNSLVIAERMLSSMCEENKLESMIQENHLGILYFLYFNIYKIR